MMKFKKPLNTAFLSVVATFFSLVTFAATDTTVVEISHTYTPYVNLTGTAPGASRFYDNDDLVTFIFPLLVNLGTMGLESNVGGNCLVSFTTDNTFELINTSPPNNSFGKYSIQYEGFEINEGNNSTISLPCTSAATDLNFILNGISFFGFDFFLPSGVYQDVVHVEVETQ